MAVESPPKGAEKTALYCYGVVAADTDLRRLKSGLGGKPVEPVRHGDIAAVTSVVPRARVRARRSDLVAHFDVLGDAFEHGTVLPLRFGIVFDDEASLVEGFLSPRHDELAGLLRELRNRVELRVTADYRAEAILSEVVQENGRIARLREATRDTAGKHPALLELGELVATQLQARTRRDAQAILERLRPLSLDYELDEQPIEYRVLRGSFLVERRRLGVFEAALSRLAEARHGTIDVKLVGPLPPHSFVALTAGEPR
jgi:Gas vesicle synthesis protein GvpL/GvpF